MTTTLLTKTALSLGIVGVLAVSAASPSSAWTQRSRVHNSAAAAAVNGVAAGVGLAAGTALGTAAAFGYEPGPYTAGYGYEPYGAGAYAYAPGFAYGPAYAAEPGYPIGDAYAYAPGYIDGPVGYNSDGGAIGLNQLGPGCPLGLKMDDRC